MVQKTESTQTLGSIDDTKPGSKHCSTIGTQTESLASAVCSVQTDPAVLAAPVVASAVDGSMCSEDRVKQLLLKQSEFFLSQLGKSEAKAKRSEEQAVLAIGNLQRKDEWFQKLPKAREEMIQDRTPPRSRHASADHSRAASEAASSVASVETSRANLGGAMHSRMDSPKASPRTSVATPSFAPKEQGTVVERSRRENIA